MNAVQGDDTGPRDKTAQPDKPAHGDNAGRGDNAGSRAKTTQTDDSAHGDTAAHGDIAGHGETAGPRDPAAVREFIERFTGQLTLAGFPRTPARIFVALLTSDSSRLTAAELGALLQASPASVSGGVRYLIQVGLVVAEGEPGSRRQHYRMPEDVWQDIVRLRDRQFARWVTDLREGVKALGPDSAAGARMAETVRYFEFISTEMSGLLARWYEQNASNGPSASGSDH